ncbi:MAG: methyltransferase domain-containing protein [Daejeonella sp.]|uniref:class I SAM-dependent methyltransferase n=1 Tax=Daejeonella sp. TaxID=2805397 RepID=UPI002736B5C4|nr:methyltransferase domain-containing protein [Daejeonella sp.]MDP3467521.1 methyltransferase domain-containing protein [Daejeonella sp.]
MNEINSTDYHDYVIKDGKLIAQFEQMYKNASDIPWRQNQQESWIDVRLTKELLADEKNISRIIDYGCGTGHYLDILVRGLGGNGLGFDISETAIVKAQNNFPNYSFKTGDLMNPNSFDVASINEESIHVIRGTLWYVFPKLSVVIKNIFDQMSSGDTLLVVQNFPPLSSNFVGKDVIPDPQTLISLIDKSTLSLQKSIWYEQFKDNANDSWFIGKFKK